MIKEFYNYDTESLMIDQIITGTPEVRDRTKLSSAELTTLEDMERYSRLLVYNGITYSERRTMLIYHHSKLSPKLEETK